MAHCYAVRSKNTYVLSLVTYVQYVKVLAGDVAPALVAM